MGRLSLTQHFFSGRRKREGAQGAQGARASLIFFRKDQCPFCNEKCLFKYELNVAVNTNLTSKVLFVFPKRIYV